MAMPYKIPKPARAYNDHALSLPPPPPGAVPITNWPLAGASGRESPFSDDAFSVIDGLDEDERAKIIQDFFEGPKTCQCCINWVEGLPDGHIEDNDEDEEENEGPPIVIRRKRTGGGANPFTIHAIEVRNAEMRKVLTKVFEGFDGILPGLKYLTFLAPFRQFFYRWEKFEQAIKDETDEELVKSLKVLRGVVKNQLKSAFAVSKDMIDHGVITKEYLWTLIKPGDLVYHCDMDGNDEVYFVRSIQALGANFQLFVQYVDWDGKRFGFVETSLDIREFTGTKKITDLNTYPVSHHEDPKGLLERLRKRGERFRDLIGVHYKSYREHGDRHGMKTLTRQVDRRIMIDAESHPDSTRMPLAYLCPEEFLWLSTGLIRQEPCVSKGPINGEHTPLPRPGERPGMMPPGMDWMMGNQQPVHVPRKMAKPGQRYQHMAPPPTPPMPQIGLLVPGDEGDPLEKQQKMLTDFHLILCAPTVRGFCLREQEWEEFNIDGIEEVEYNTQPFDSLVLPEGYKDLILAFVESQLKEGDSFDDVINGKGGGLVVLLSGVPGVGKTLTAESVAERIHAPLYKLELRESAPSHVPGNRSDSEEDKRPHEIDDQFRWAAKWNAVLLIDECDTYLQTRSDNDARRNRLVQTFLQKLEYYPSLLFLTTNRPGTLDPALSSRIHLTINYPALDPASRLTIWRNFLARAKPAAHITEEEIRMLAGLELDGRRIKNLVKSAGIMARREGRGVDLGDLRKVLRITEGVIV